MSLASTATFHGRLERRLTGVLQSADMKSAHRHFAVPFRGMYARGQKGTRVASCVSAVMQQCLGREGAMQRQRHDFHRRRAAMTGTHPLQDRAVNIQPAASSGRLPRESSDAESTERSDGRCRNVRVARWYRFTAHPTAGTHQRQTQPARLPRPCLPDGPRLGRLAQTRRRAPLQLLLHAL